MTAYNIDRKTASKLLNVSLRTIDRYLKHEKLSSIKSNGRIWLSKDEIIALSGGNTTETSRPYRRSQSHYVDPDIITDKTDNVSNSQRQHASFTRETPNYTQPHTDTTLVDNLRKEIAIKDKRLTQASYRIGQLEAQIQTMVPQLEFEKQQKLLAAQNEDFERRIKEKEAILQATHNEYQQEIITKSHEIQEIAKLHKEVITEKEHALTRLDRELHLEKINKWIYAVILYVLVIGLVILLVVSRGL